MPVKLFLKYWLLHKIINNLNLITIIYVDVCLEALSNLNVLCKGWERFAFLFSL